MAGRDDSPPRRKNKPKRSSRRRMLARQRGQPYRSSVTGAPREMKRYFIAQFLPNSDGLDVYPMRALQLASVQIQRVTRGSCLRRRFGGVDWEAVRRTAVELGEDPVLAQLRAARAVARPPQSFSSQGEGRRSPRSRSPMLDKYLTFLKVHEERRLDVPAYASGGFAVWAAARIQAWWRMLGAQWRFAWRRFRVYHIASQQIQFLWKTYQQEMYIQLEGSKAGTPLIQPRRSPEDAAVTKIQHAWRTYTNVRIFHYYRDLIQFRLTGDPAALLKTINPREAALFDKATGIHVRFRLGGRTFPPTMFYKVFLLNPLCDVGAFAPRDYTDMKQADAHQLNLHKRAEVGKPLIGGPLPTRLHNADDGSVEALGGSKLYKVGVAQTRLGQIRVGGSYFGTRIEGLGPDGTSNWYRRVENNEWRPITQRILGEQLAPEVQAPPGAMSAAEKASFAGGIAFHYSRVKRKEDTRAKRKAKKRAWLMRMYQEGLAKEREDGPPPAFDDDHREAGRGSRGGVVLWARGRRPNGGDGGGGGDDEEEEEEKKNWSYSRGSFDEADEEEKLERVLTGVGASRPKARTTQNSAVLRALGDGPGAMDDEDVEGLLAWSNELDYDAYVANWHVLATSGTSGSDFHEPVNNKGRRFYNGASMGGLPEGINSAPSTNDTGPGGFASTDVPEPDWGALNEQLHGKY